MDTLLIVVVGSILFFAAGLLVDLWTKRQEKLGR